MNTLDRERSKASTTNDKTNSDRTADIREVVPIDSEVNSRLAVSVLEMRANSPEIQGQTRLEKTFA